ncbi:MAG: hypothetical protein SOX63_02370 [Eubacteriales bacterium]|nr:hypothetical protein [Eubacteriales bacterium]
MYSKISHAKGSKLHHGKCLKITCKSMMSFLTIVYIETKSKDTEKYKKYAKNDMTMLVKFRLQNQMIAHTIGIHF